MGSFCKAALVAMVSAGLGALCTSAQARQDARQLAAIKHACAVKALPASECGGQASSAAPSAPAASNGTGGQAMQGGTFVDPQGRYRFAAPAGWDLKLQGDTPTFVNGQAWIAVVAASGATPQAAAQAVGAQFQPAFSRINLVNQGPTQFGGHEGFGIDAGGLSRAKGQDMSVRILAIAAGGGHDLVIVSAIPVEQAQALTGGVMEIANSARFQGE